MRACFKPCRRELLCFGGINTKKKSSTSVHKGRSEPSENGFLNNCVNEFIV